MNFQFTKDSRRRYNLFLERVQGSSEVWGLKNDSGWAVVESNEYVDTVVMLFWSDKSYAAQCAVDEWNQYLPTVIPFKDFCDQWLPGLHNDDLMVGINWTKELIGLEIEPLELLGELKNI